MIVRTSNLMKAKRSMVLQVTSKAHLVIKIFQNSLLDAHDEIKNNMGSFKMRSVVRLCVWSIWMLSIIHRIAP